ncbi:unnamed protein product, partial [Leptidea sinapis]
MPSPIRCGIPTHDHATGGSYSLYSLCCSLFYCLYGSAHYFKLLKLNTKSHFDGRIATEEKQLDFVEQVESVAYVLCGDGVISSDHFQLILKNKVVTNKLLRVVDSDGDGFATADEIMEPRDGIDKSSVDRLEQLFRQTVGNQKEITREQFQKIVVSKNPFFTERVFQIFDEDNSGTISHNEFIDAVHRFGKQTPEDKIRFMFKPRELQHVMRACMEENGMQFSERQLRQLTDAMFEDADLEGRGAITYEALRDQLSKHGGIDRWLVPPKPQPKPTLMTRLRRMKPYQLSMPYFRNNHVFIAYLAIFFLINFGLFVARLVEYRSSNIFVMPVSELHLQLGPGLIVVNDPVLNVNNYTVWEWIGTTKPGLFGLVDGVANPTGLALCVALLVLSICSGTAVRRGGCFEIFYFTHLLYIPFWMLLIFHAPNFWKWFIVPGTIYTIERIMRLTWMRSEQGKTYIASGILLPSRVTHLVVKRPPLFHFHAGDYVFVNIPNIALYEWHPFTISSAPEQKAMSPRPFIRPLLLSPLRFLEKSSSMPDVFNNIKKKQKSP